MHALCVTSKLLDPAGSILTKSIINRNGSTTFLLSVNSFKTVKKIGQTNGGTRCPKWNFIVILIQIVESHKTNVYLHKHR